MEKHLNELVERLRKAHGDALISVILYGSAAGRANEVDKLSDYNVLCVLQQVTARELGQAEPIFHWWREMSNPSPLLLSEEELRNSTDCFAIEMTDMKRHRRVLHGTDPIEGVEVDYAFYRARVEYELRAKLLRLRQKAAGLLSDRELLLRLMADSLSTFCVLFRHALMLAGDRPEFGKREVVEMAAAKFGIAREPFLRLIDVREGKLKPRELSPAELFPEYLSQIQVVVDAVDRMER